MTTEDLILEYFDGALTPEQESRLRAEVNASPEARALFEHHRSLHAMFGADVASLAPSSALDSAVIAAALGTVPEAVGSGALSWLSGKVAVGISAVVIGGLSVALLSTGGPEPAPAVVQPAPAVRTVPDAVQPSAEQPPAATPKSEVAEETPGKARPSTVEAAEPRNAVRAKERATARPVQKPGLRIDTSDQPRINHPPVLRSDGADK